MIAEPVKLKINIFIGNVKGMVWKKFISLKKNIIIKSPDTQFGVVSPSG